MSTLLEDDLTVKSLTVGNGISTGAAAPVQVLNKTTGGTASYQWKAANVLRAQAQLDASENLVITVYDTDGTTAQGSITIAQADGVVTLSEGLTVTTGKTVTVTGCTIVGLHTYLTIRITNLVAADAKVYGLNCPVAGTITRIASVLEGAALAAGDATITAAIGATGVTDGVITITQAGSAAGDLDAVTPSAANTVAVGSYLNFTVGGANTDTAAFADLTITILRSA